MIKIGDLVERINHDNGDAMKLGEQDVVIDVFTDLRGTFVVTSNHLQANFVRNLKVVIPKNYTEINVDENIHLIIKDKAVVMIDEAGHKGLALCNPEDTFDLDEGVKRAMKRLLEVRGEIK